MPGPPGGFGFGANIMGELKKKQKDAGRYVKQHSSESSTGSSVGSAAPPIPRRPSAGEEQATAPLAKQPSAELGSVEEVAQVAAAPPPLPGRAAGSRESMDNGRVTSTPGGIDGGLQAALARRRQKEEEIDSGFAAASPVAAAATADAAGSAPARTLSKKSSSGKMAAAKYRADRAKRLSGTHQNSSGASSAASSAAAIPAVAAAPTPTPAPAPMVKEATSTATTTTSSSPAPAPVQGMAAAAAKLLVAEPVTAPKRRDMEPAREAYSEWEVYYADGEPYYSNRVTGETTWDKPLALMSAAEADSLSGDFVWVPHDQLSWIPAKVLEKRPNGDYVVAEQARDTSIELEPRRTVKAKDVGPAVGSAQALTSLTNDLVQLDEVHEPGVIDLLRRRYAADKIYTYVGDILVAVNPFKPTDLFAPNVMYTYAQTGREAMELPPHPYAVINSAYRAMIEDAKNQSLLISGESGAGKTVTVKVCLEFLSEVAGSNNNIEQKILAANPILEAFGNAKTVRNDNSSRFGKFMEVHFDRDYRIVGCHTLNYLLEKSRVVDQATGERNFHVFHYLVNEFDEAKRRGLKVDAFKATDFHYLPSASVDRGQHDDAGECGKMLQALGEMGFSDAEQDGMFRAVAAILHLGNLEFEDFESTGSKVKNTPACARHLELFCDLSGTKPEGISDALTMHISQQRDGLLKRAFNPKVASDVRNALARHMYNRLFEWIVGRINKELMPEGLAAAMSRSNRDLLGKNSGNFIGMLDIFGFEIFEINSFEQLCINFANEKLQQMFNRHTFTLEEETYKNEGVQFEKIEFHDSQPLLTFLGLHAVDAPAVRDGVFQLLDEQTTMMQGTDQNFLTSISSRHSDKRKLFSDRCKSRTAFQVFHYAGAVEYETGGFVYKNADKLYENIESAMQASTVPFIAGLFADKTTSASSGGVSAIRSRVTKKTQASTFMRQLSQLEGRTNMTFPRYIRCVKPNASKRPNIFSAPMSLEQLRFAGVFEAVQIRKKGYPFRKTHADFFATYRCVDPSAVSRADWQAARKSGNFARAAEALLAALASRAVPAAADCRFGKTMVLYRADQHRALEIQRLGVLNRAAAEIQKHARGLYVRNHITELRHTRDLLAGAIRSRDLSQIEKALAVSNGLFFKLKEAYDAEAVREAIKMESSLAPIIAQLMAASGAPESCFDDKVYGELDGVCSQMSRFMKRDALAFRSNKGAIELLERYEDFKEQRDLRSRLAAALEQVGVRANKLSTAESREVVGQADARRRPLAPSLAGLLEQVRQTLALLTEEARLFAACAAACAACYVSPPDAGSDNIGVEQTEANLAELAQAVAAAKAAQVVSTDGVDAMQRCEWALSLYRAVVEAMRNAEHADDPEWEAVEALVGEGQGISVRANELFAFDSEQLALLGAELALRAQVDAVVRKLAEAVHAVNDETMSTALEQAHALKLDSHKDPQIKQLVERADYLLPKIRQTRATMVGAIQAVNEMQLYEALTLQRECLWGDQAGMVGNETVERARTLYTQVQNLTREARVAVNALEVDPTANIVNGCQEIGLSLPELTPLREFLALPQDRQLLRQREAAVALQNYRRAIALSLKHKDLLFDSQSGNNFALEFFPKLKTPEEFAKRLFGTLTVSKYKQNMLHHYKPTFGTMHALTTLDNNGVASNGKSLNKTATLLFKNVCGIMGDKIYENVEGLVVELMITGLQTPDLVDEIYCQIMKQVTKNPKPDSEARGWNLMSMVLATFPPSSQLENYLEHFLRTSGRTACVRLLHCVLLCGPLRAAPSSEEIAQVRQPGLTDLWFSGHRTNITVDKDALQGAIIPDQVVVDWRSPQGVEQGDAAPSAPINPLPAAEPSYGAGAPPPVPPHQSQAPPPVPPHIQEQGPPPVPPHQQHPVQPQPPAPPAPPQPPRTGAMSGGPPPPPPKKVPSNRGSLSAAAPPPPPPPPQTKKSAPPPVPAYAGGPPAPPPPPPKKLPSRYSSIDDDDLL